MTRSRVALVVEDNPSALVRAVRALKSREVEVHACSHPEEAHGRGFLGSTPGGGLPPVDLPWSRVAVLFCDRELPGGWKGEDIVEAAAKAGVPTIIGMSSSTIFNQALARAGAGLTDLKPNVLARLEKGEFDAALPRPKKP